MYTFKNSCDVHCTELFFNWKGSLCLLFIQQCECTVSVYLYINFDLQHECYRRSSLAIMHSYMSANVEDGVISKSHFLPRISQSSSSLVLSWLKGPSPLQYYFNGNWWLHFAMPFAVLLYNLCLWVYQLSAPIQRCHCFYIVLIKKMANELDSQCSSWEESC